MFTTKDGTDEGTGELDGLDIHDILEIKILQKTLKLSKEMLSDKDWGRIALKTLSEWDSATTNNSSGIQLSNSIIHGNQHIEPGNMIQALVNTAMVWIIQTN